MISSSPRISVVVPVYKDWHNVSKLLRSLERQTFDQEKFEVILVANDEGPTKPLDHKLLDFTLLECGKPGSYAARNVGWQEAVSEWVAFTDADCIADDRWLERLSTASETMRFDLLAGDISIIKDEATTVYTDYDQILGLPQRTYVERGYAATANLTIRRSVLRELGGFEEDRFSGGDAELCCSAVQNGFRLGFLADAVVLHPARSSFSEHFKKLQRVRGGQIRSGVFARRLKYFFRISFPPLRRTLHVISSTNTPKVKFNALLALYLLWFVGLLETIRLLLGGSPVR